MKMEPKTFGGIMLTLMAFTGLIILPVSFFGGLILISLSAFVSYAVMKRNGDL
jgi:accessory gene regulator protein AgrB